MTYERLYDLKFNKHLPTYQLGMKYPREKRRISKIALLQLPFSMLKKLLKREQFNALKVLKQKLTQKKETA